MSARLRVLCAGAAQGLLEALRAPFESESGATLEVTFGAVGVLRELFVKDEPCDVLIVTDAMAREPEVTRGLAGEARRIGKVRTGLAVRAADPSPDVTTVAALKQALLAATALYAPDTRRSTAGVHVASVLGTLGIAEALAGRLHTFANGAAAMHGLAVSAEPGGIGCTQATEIVRTPGLRYLGPLPGEVGLATDYAAAVGGRSGEPALASRFVGLLSGPATASIRIACGFEPAAD